ncbi:hypothetical protein ACY5GP_001436 [Cronobacter sakazakii]
MYVNLNKRLPKSFKVPTDQDVKHAVDEVLKEIMFQSPVATSAPVTITKTGKVRKPRQPKVTPNTLKATFRQIHEYSNMLSEVEDVFMGAIRQTTTNSQHNRYIVFNLLKHLDVISTVKVYMMVNSHRQPTEYISIQYAKELAAICRNVINAFDHHAEVKNISRYIRESAIDTAFDQESDEFGYTVYQQPVQTSEQKRQRLQETGLTEWQVDQYMSGHKVQHGVSLNIGSGASVGLISFHGDPITYPDDVDSLKWLPDLYCYVDELTGEMFSWD